MNNPKQRFNITSIEWRKQSMENRIALDHLIESINMKTGFTGKINKNEHKSVYVKFFHHKIVCWQRKLENGDIERWVEYHGKVISDVVVFEKE